MLTPLLTAVTPTPVAVPLSVFLTPSSLSTSSTNGTYITPTFTANVSGGVKPYSYNWQVYGEFSLHSESGNTAKAKASGYDAYDTGTIVCIVTDDDSNIVAGSASLAVSFS